jgi:DNA uptake protein ComE-like DNA-binding protein
VAYRDLNGPFTSVDELADVAGITPHLQDVLAERLVIR